MKKLLTLAGLLATTFGLGAADVNITNITKAATLPAGSYVLGITGSVTRLISTDLIGANPWVASVDAGSTNSLLNVSNVTVLGTLTSSTQNVGTLVVTGAMPGLALLYPGYDISNIEGVWYGASIHGIGIQLGTMGENANAVTVADGDIFANGFYALGEHGFVGDGANLTNLNASALASGTVPLARLGTNTASAGQVLASDTTNLYWTAAGTGGGITNNQTGVTLSGSFTGSLTGSSSSVSRNVGLTNVTFWDALYGARPICITNASGPYGTSNPQFGQQETIWFPAHPTNAFSRIVWSQTTPRAVNHDIMFWPNHNLAAGTPELIFNAAPGSLCFYYDHIQWGQPSHAGPTYEYWKYTLHGAQLDRDTGETNFCLWPGATWCFQSLVRTNSGENDVRFGGSLGATSGNTKMPTIMFRPTSTNGSAAWIWMDDFDPSLRGSASGVVTGWGTNTHYWFSDNTYTERFRITAGPDGGLSFNGRLTVNGAVGLTTNYTLASGEVMSVSNGIIVRIALPEPYAWNAIATNYLVRIGQTVAVTNALATNVNEFVKSALGTLTNLDAFYLFCTTAESNTLNLLGTSYTLTNTGTVTSDATGIQGDGAVGTWVDTGWKNISTNSGTLWCFRSETGTVGTNVYNGWFGARTRNDSVGFVTGLLTLGAQTNTWYYGVNGAGAGGHEAYTRNNAAPMSIGISRTEANKVLFLINNDTSGSTYSGKEATGIPTNTVHILHMNCGVESPLFSGWNGKVQAFGMGSNRISAAQSAALYRAMTNFNGRMGR